MNIEQPLPILDDQVKIREIDTRNFLRIIDELPEQCETALEIGKNTKIKSFDELYSSVCITGVGDNAIAADIVGSILSDYCDIPILINHGEKLPNSVGEKTLVFVVDYTGKSKCIMANYMEAVQRKCTIYCLVGSGPLLKQAKKDGSSVVIIPPAHSSRTATGYLVIPIISILETIGLISGVVNKLVSSIMLLKNNREVFRATNPKSKNLAKQIAELIADKNTMIFGASGYQEVIARHFESQLLNNSHSLSTYFVFPDNTAHWGLLTSKEEYKTKIDNTYLLFLRDKKDETEVPLMMDGTRDIMEGVSYIDIDIKGTSETEKILYGIYLADYVSYYIAILKGINPSFSSIADEFAEKVDSYQQIDELEPEISA